MVLARYKRTHKHKIGFVLLAVVAVIGVITPYGARVFAAPGDYSYSYSVGTQGKYTNLNNIVSASDGSQWVLNNGDTPSEIIHVSPAGSRLGAITLPEGTYQYTATTLSPTGDLYVTQHNWQNNTTSVLRYYTDGTFDATIALSTALSYANTIAVDALGNIYGVNGGTVYKFLPNGTLLSSFSPTGSGSYITIKISGTNLYVAGYYGNNVQRLTLDGTILQTWNGVANPYGMVVHSDGSVLVLSQSTNSFVVLDPSGSVTPHVADQVIDGNGIGIDQDGNIFVAGSGLGRLQKFSSTYAYQASYKIDSDPQGALVSPNVMTRDSQGNLYVYDNSNQSEGADNDHRAVQKFNASGQLVDTIVLHTQYMSSDAQHSYYVYPYAMAIDTDGSIIVAGNFSKTDNGVSQQYATARYSASGGEPEFGVKTHTPIKRRERMYIFTHMVSISTQ